MKISIAVRVLIGSLPALAIGYGVYSFTRFRKPEAMELPDLRRKLGLLQQNLSETHPEVRRQVRMIAELERDPASLLGTWVQLDKTAVWDFRDDGGVHINTKNAGIISGKFSAVGRNIVRLDFGPTNIHTGLVYRRVADGQLTLIDATGKKTVLGLRQ